MLKNKHDSPHFLSQLAMHDPNSRLAGGPSGSINLQGIFEELDNLISDREAAGKQSDHHRSPFKHA